MEVVSEPGDMLLFLLNREVVILREACNYKLHEVPDWTLPGERFIKVLLQKHMLMEGHTCLILQSWKSCMCQKIQLRTGLKSGRRLQPIPALELTSLIVDWILPKFALFGPLDHLFKAIPRRLICSLDNLIS